MKWTKDQQQAQVLLNQWIAIKNRTDEDRFFSLYGSAGTGKTTVVNGILSYLNKYKVCVSAPTHTAKDVISEVTGKEGHTLHSLLGLRPNLDLEDYDPANPAYATLAQMRISEYDIIIVDECSMVNSSLFKTLQDAAVQYNVLVIYVGDAVQLPPVGETISKTFLVKHKAELREIVRQETSSPNQELLLNARMDVETNTGLLDTIFNSPKVEVNRFNEHNKEQGYIATNSQEAFYEKLIELYSDSEAKNNPRFIKTLAFTNVAVEKLNVFIKNRINPSTEKISNGDFLLGYSTCIVNDVPLVRNGVSYTVYFVEIITLQIIKRPFKFYKVTISKEGKSINILHPDSYQDYHTALERLYDNALDKRAWRPFYSFKEKFITMQNWIHSSRLSYGKPALMAKKDIDLGYAQTVHKSQGSTYNNVAVIYHNFKTCRNIADRKRLRYVALSRTKYLNLVYI